MAEVVRRILEAVGLETDRFRIDWASAAEAPRFVQIVTDFTEKIKEIGPLGEREGLDQETIRLRLGAARELTAKNRFRAAYGNLARNLKKSGDYSPEGIARLVEEKLVPLIKKELLEAEIKALLGKGPVSLDSLLKKTGASQEEVIPVLEALAKRGQVEQTGDVWQPKAKE